MNGFDLFKAINNADMKYIEQADSFTKTKKHSTAKAFKLSVGIAAAAALMTVTAASAAIYTHFVNNEGVGQYLADDSVNILEEQGLALNYTAENEHIRLTVDAMLSDGNLGKMIMTLEGLDTKGIETVKKCDPMPEIYLTDRETGEYIANPLMDGSAIITGGGHVNYDAQNENLITFVTWFEVWNIETNKPYTLRFGLADNTLPYEERLIREDFDVLTNNLMEGIAFDTDFTPNIGIKELKSDDGEKVYLSQIGLFSEDDALSLPTTGHNTSKLIIKDNLFNKKIEYDSRTVSRDASFDKPKTSMWFSEIIDVENYCGIEINGLKYTE